MTSVRTLIVDDHILVRAGLCLLVKEFDHIEVVGEAGDADRALALIESEHPDLVLMDIAMPGVNGLQATVQIKERFPETRVIVLSMHLSEEHVLEALRAGASGYLLKNSAPLELGFAFEAVMSGSIYLSPLVSRQLVDGYLDRVGTRNRKPDPLSPRQKEVLRLVADGCSTKEIARRLGISIKTVETHRTQLMARLDIHDVAGLVRYSIEAGLVNTGKH